MASYDSSTLKTLCLFFLIAAMLAPGTMVSADESATPQSNLREGTFAGCGGSHFGRVQGLARHRCRFGAD